MSEDEVECSVAEGSHILKRTLKSLGYNDLMAELGVWSALWLERRGHHGITELIVYMLLMQGRRFAELEPRRHPEYMITGICPFMLATFVCEREDIVVKKGGIALGAPASPNLLMPAVVDLFSLSGKSLRLQHQHYSCLFSQGGMEFESDNFGAFGMPSGNEDNGPMLLELTSEQVEEPLRKLDRICLPRARLGTNRILNLTDKPLSQQR